MTLDIRKEKERSLSRDRSRGKLRIDSMGSDILKDISSHNGAATRTNSKTSLDLDQAGFPRSTKATVGNKKQDKSSKLKKQPKKIEVSLALDLSSHQSESNISRTTLKAQQEFADELIKKGEELKEKKKLLAEIAEKEEIKHCAIPLSRNFDQFLTDQIIYADKKETRIKFAQLKADQERLVNDPIPQPVISQVNSLFWARPKQ